MPSGKKPQHPGSVNSGPGTGKPKTYAPKEKPPVHGKKISGKGKKKG